MKVLCHVCCAPCYLGPLAALRREGAAVTGFFYNPNIHPLIEFRRRLKAVKVFAARGGGPVVCDETYGLELFLAETVAESLAARRTAPPAAKRCAACYSLRLRRAAEAARAQEADAFTTSMLASRHLDHEMVRRTGEAVGAAFGVAFLYRDFRPLAEAAYEEAGRLHLYRQSYCGCIFSENERYRDTAKHLYGSDE